MPGKRKTEASEKKEHAQNGLRSDSYDTMKTLFSLFFVGLVSTAVAQLDTAKNVAHSTVRGAENAAETVAHGAKRAADKVADALTPDPDAHRVDVVVNNDRVDMPTSLSPGKTAFVVKNEGSTAQNFEVEGATVDRKFVTPPGPGETRVLHVTLKKGNYAVYSRHGDKRGEKMTLHVK